MGKPRGKQQQGRGQGTDKKRVDLKKNLESDIKLREARLNELKKKNKKNIKVEAEPQLPAAQPPSKKKDDKKGAKAVKTKVKDDKDKTVVKTKDKKKKLDEKTEKKKEKQPKEDQKEEGKNETEKKEEPMNESKEAEK